MTVTLSIQQLTPQKEQKIIEIYSQGFGLHTSGRMAGVNQYTVRRVLEKNKIPLRSRGEALALTGKLPYEFRKAQQK